ncbi:MAG: response regulator [Chthoniobacteraceae bacterium]
MLFIGTLIALWSFMRFLIADDEKDFATFLSIMIEDAGHEVAEVVALGGMSVLRAYSECRPDVVMMDIMMPQLNGVTSTRQILSKDPDARVVMMSGMLDSKALQLTAANAGAVGVLHKPFSQVQFKELIAGLCAQSGANAMPLTR